MRATPIAVVTATVLVAGSITPTRADDVNCPPDLGAVTIDGNVLVAAPCRLEGTTVKGNVQLYAGGSLIARDAYIDGNIQAEDSDFIDVSGTHVDGSIQLDDLVGDRSTIAGSTVEGNIQLNTNRSLIEVVDNTVGADVQAFSNSGGVVVSGNIIDGNLQCKSNTPEPTGGDNQVSGNKEDQCANLSPAGGGADSSGSVTEPGSAVQAQDAGNGGGAAGFPGILLLALFLAGRGFRRVCKRG